MSHGPEHRAIHQLVIVTEYGPVIRTWPVPASEKDKAMKTIQQRYDAGIANRLVIAAFWYIDGTIHTMTFCRA